MKYILCRPCSGYSKHSNCDMRVLKEEDVIAAYHINQDLKARAVT